MFDHLLVPLDGSPEAASALPLARAVARATHGEIVLSRVVPERTDAATREELAQANSYLERIAHELEADGLAVRSIARAGNPEPAILAVARESGADLVVMATHGRTGIGRAVLGSVAEHVMTHTTIPMLLLRPGGKRVAAIQSILVPVDGSPGAALALKTAMALAQATKARLSLVDVAVPLPAWAYADYGPDGTVFLSGDWDEDTLAAAKAYLEGLAPRVRAAGIEVESFSEVGQVGETVRGIAEKQDADLIVMSTHAYTGVARAVLGSVADELVRTARRPVLVLRHGVPAAAHAEAPAASEQVGAVIL